MLFVLVFLCLLLSPLPAAADLGGFTIASFHTDLTVGSDADLRVEERIEVDFLEPRRGIYRVIPVRYMDRLGTQFSLGFRLSGVDDGQGNAYGVKVSNEGRNVQIRIGDPDVTVTGRRTYVIRYTVRNALGRFPDHDEIYWNATGNEWGTSIARATATLHLPESVPQDSVKAIGYAGAFGEKSIDVRVTTPVGPGKVFFETATPLAPMQGLTVDAIWPLGHVVHPSQATQTARFANDNLPLLFPWSRSSGCSGSTTAWDGTPRGPQPPWCATRLPRESPPPSWGL